MLYYAKFISICNAFICSLRKIQSITCDSVYFEHKVPRTQGTGTPTQGPRFEIPHIYFD